MTPSIEILEARALCADLPHYALKGSPPDYAEKGTYLPVEAPPAVPSLPPGPLPPGPVGSFPSPSSTFA